MGFKEYGKTSKYYNAKDKLKYPVKDENENPYGMHVWKGVSSSTQIWGPNIYLLLDSASKVVKDMTALEYIKGL
jgi:hypothetical protein